VAGAGLVKIDDRVWRKLLAEVHGLAQMHVRVGVLSSRGGDETQEDENGEPITMTELAAIAEFGTVDETIPPRRMIRGTFEEAVDELAATCGKLAKAVVTNGMDPRIAYGLLGQWGKARVRRYVTEKHVRPLDLPSTVVAKNRRAGKPADAEFTTLVDTGRLLNAVDYEVVEGDVAGELDSTEVK
jgi:hypothetical protein